MSKHSKLIGEHPKSGLFFNWCTHKDLFKESNEMHRKLVEKDVDEIDLIDHLADWIIEHHASPDKIERFKIKKAILKKHNFKQYIEKRMPFPVKNKNTQKGNLGEIILAEYLTSSSKLNLLIYKLRFNPNIEQSMKGDDVLLFNKKNIPNKIIVGESKFRKTPDSESIEDITYSLSEDKLPISLTFISDRLFEQGEKILSEQIDDLISKTHKGKIPIVYAGFLISSSTTYKQVAKHLKSSNKNLVFISLNLKKPEDLIKKSFRKANSKLMDL